MINLQLNSQIRTLSIIFCAIVLINLVACGELANNETLIPPLTSLSEVASLLEVDEVYQDLDLKIISIPEDVIEGETIELILTNNTDKKISFAPGYGTRLFIYKSNQKRWVEIPNLVNYIGEGDTLEPREKENSNWIAHVTVAPSISSFEKSEILRIGIVGKLVENSNVTNYKVGTYLDISLH